MKYAFIDYENLNSLDGLALQEYDRLFLFIGASNNQTEIRLTEKFNDELNITLITVKGVAKNNLDFHLAYYLGKLDEKTEKSVEFYILSNDQGYDGICEFIQHQKLGRICRRKSIQPEKQPVAQINHSGESKLDNLFQKYVQYLKQTATKNLPVKLKSLKNHIHNYLGLVNMNKNDAEKIVNSEIEKLKAEKWVKIADNKVSYLKG